mmetsp:Transcript_19518/g.48118  ORF Transcript_19518/g.48118 Transcript_19518/m.48118 type:complete len:152 (+) Transcript_19518:75-530(+)
MTATSSSSSNAKKQTKIPTKASSSKTSGSSVFDRLHKTATISSSAPKNESKALTKARNSKTSKRSVFDRLHKTSTISSRTRKVIAPVIPQNILTREDKNQQGQNVAPKPQTRSRKKAHNTGPVFDRLYKQETLSSKTKRKNVLGPRNNLPV